MGIRRTALGTTIIGLAVPAAALAGAVLDLPAIDAKHTLSPKNPLVLTWHLDNGSVADQVVLADKPARDTNGAFLADNVVASQLYPGVSWQPKDALWAGQYWWIVHTNDLATPYSTLGRFTEATVLNYTKWHVYHDRKHGKRLALALSYTTNARRIKLTLNLMTPKGKRLVPPIVRYDTPTGPLVTTNPTNINWLPKTTIKRGTPVKIQITVQAGPKSVTQTITTKAS